MRRRCALAGCIAVATAIGCARSAGPTDANEGGVQPDDFLGIYVGEVTPTLVDVQVVDAAWPSPWVHDITVEIFRDGGLFLRHDGPPPGETEWPDGAVSMNCEIPLEFLGDRVRFVAGSRCRTTTILGVAYSVYLEGEGVVRGSQLRLSETAVDDIHLQQGTVTYQHYDEFVGQRVH